MLNSQNINKQTTKFFRELPTETLRSRMYMPLQSKNDIYDSKCKGCGFMLVLVVNGGETKRFKNVEDARQYSIKEGGDMYRTCEYPGNIIETSNDSEPEYPSLTEIVMNTCMLWQSKYIESNDNVLEEVTIKEENIGSKEKAELPDRQLS